MRPKKLIEQLDADQRKDLLAGLLKKHRQQAVSDAILASSWLVSLLKNAGRQDLATKAQDILDGLL